MFVQTSRSRAPNCPSSGHVCLSKHLGMVPDAGACVRGRAGDEEVDLFIFNSILSIYSSRNNDKKPPPLTYPVGGEDTHLSCILAVLRMSALLHCFIYN